MIRVFNVNVRKLKCDLLWFMMITQIIFLLPKLVYGDELDDISIQVIGLDEIPDAALERIPLPSPDFGGLTDLHHDIILNRANGQGTATDTLSPTPVTSVPVPPETGAGQ